MFKLLRYYAAASLVAVLVTAGLFMWLDRQASMQGIVRLAERSNVELAQLAMKPVKPMLLEFLGTVAEVRPGSAGPLPPPELARSLGNVTDEDPVIVKIRIYNPHGAVVFSTQRNEIGLDQSHDKGFVVAMGGEVSSELTYRDAFNTFDGPTEDDNVMRTWLPVRTGPAGPVRGVFELYGDVNSMHQTEELEVTLMAGAVLLLLALYAVQVLIVRHAHKTIELQQRTIQDRNETLALLADQMIKTEESHKQKIAFELHEGVAQTLAALKMKAESGKRRRKVDDATDRSAKSLIPMLQEVIQEVRAIATDLRPGSLDDLGLVPTIQSFCRAFEAGHPGVRIERLISVEESDIPMRLKGILYRIVTSVIGAVAESPKASGVRLRLELDGDEVVLVIDDAATVAPDGPAAAATQIQRSLGGRFGRMEELTTLSGGTFSAAHHPDGGTTLRAAWRRGSTGQKHQR